MTVFRYFDEIEKLIHQNQAIELEYKEGCLLDNYLIATKRGYMAIIEQYVNCWSSCYKCYFSTNESDIYSIWDKMTA